MSDQSVMGRPTAFKSVEELEAKIEEYFKTDAFMDIGFDDNGNPIKQFAPTLTGLALALGVDRKTIYNYSQKDDYFPAIKKARSRVENALERHLYTKNVTGAIFNLKNNFGWNDRGQDSDDGQDSAPIKIQVSVVDASKSSS